MKRVLHKTYRRKTNLKNIASENVRGGTMLMRVIPQALESSTLVPVNEQACDINLQKIVKF